jgi:hypothetical protein
MHTTTSNNQNILAIIKGAIPLVLLIITGTAQYFNLQGQVIELRARYEASTSTTKEAVDSLKADIRETNSLLRDIVRKDDQRNNQLKVY